MKWILFSILVFMNFFFLQCAKFEGISTENKTSEVKIPAIKEFVLGKTWENKLRKLGAMDYEKLLAKGEKGIPILRLNFQDNDNVRIENYKIDANGEQNLVTLEGNYVSVKLISVKEYQYQIQNENEIIIDYKQPHIVTKKDEETLNFKCINNTKHPLIGCDLDFFEYRNVNQ